ncbi:MAG TPA: hypothetical protein VFM18_07070, partial [Methanosarcina sp.]|nr:hypothetical protein [Methanosarcina sp.]
MIVDIIIAISLISLMFDMGRKAKKYNELKPRLDSLDSYKKELESKESDLKNTQTEWEKKVQSDIEAINILAKEKSQGFP